VLLAMLAVARGVHFAVEQPSTSKMPMYPAMRNFLLKLAEFKQVFFTRFHMGCFGALSVKPTMLFGTPSRPKCRLKPCSSVIRKSVLQIAGQDVSAVRVST
jgi:hypothetical protein